MTKNKIYIFGCENAVEEDKFDNGIYFKKVACSGRLEETIILKAFEEEAAGVLVFACYEGACKYLSGNVKASKRIEYVKKILKQIGIEDNRLQLHYVQANQSDKHNKIINLT